MGVGTGTEGAAALGGSVAKAPDAKTPGGTRTAATGTNYRVAVCDDSATDGEYVRSLVERWAGARGAGLAVDVFDEPRRLLSRLEDGQAYDILLLDVEMPGLDGVSLAKAVRRLGQAATQIVFVTGYSDYIAEGYDVAALHYLMKPVSPVKLNEVLDRAADHLTRDARCLNLEVAGGVTRVPLAAIRYLDVRRNNVTVHADADFTVKRPLSEFADELTAMQGFVRVGRSLIVSLRTIRRVTKTEVHLTDGTVLPLPRGAYEPLNRAIIAS